MPLGFKFTPANPERSEKRCDLSAPQGDIFCEKSVTVVLEMAHPGKTPDKSGFFYHEGGEKSKYSSP
jgi:hypothetical protein